MMAHIRQMALLPVLVLASAVASCKQFSSSTITGAAACAGKYGKAYDDCVHASAGPLGGQEMAWVSGMQQQAAISVISSMGHVHQIKSTDGTQCLTVNGQQPIWGTCNNFAMSQQFHFVDMVDVAYQAVPGARLASTAFRIATRASVKSHVAADSEEKAPPLMCLSSKANATAMVRCEDATFFTTLVNSHDGRNDAARKVENQWVSLVAFVADTSRLHNAFKANTKATEQAATIDPLAGILGPSSKKTEPRPPAKPVVIDLGNLAGRTSCDALRELVAEGVQAVTRCPATNVVADQEQLRPAQLYVLDCGLSRLDLEANCQGAEPIKSYHEFMTDLREGPVAQLLTKGDEFHCVEARGGQAVINEHCDQNAHDHTSTQFRVEILPGASSNGQSKARIRSLANRDQCLNLDTMRLGPCQSAKAFPFDAVVNDLVANPGGKLTSFFLQPCLIASSQSQNASYDCRFEIPYRYRAMEKASIALAMIPIVGNLASIILDGVTCGAGLGAFSDSACIGMSIGILFEVGQFEGSFLGAFAKFGHASAKAVAATGARFFARSLVARGVTGAEEALAGQNVAIIEGITRGQLDSDSLAAALKGAREGHNCGGASCNRWWNPFPAPGAETHDYLLNLRRQAMYETNLSPADKAKVLRVLEPLLKAAP